MRVADYYDFVGGTTITPNSKFKKAIENNETYLKWEPGTALISIVGFSMVLVNFVFDGVLMLPDMPMHFVRCSIKEVGVIDTDSLTTDSMTIVSCIVCRDLNRVPDCLTSKIYVSGSVSNNSIVIATQKNIDIVKVGV